MKNIYLFVTSFAGGIRYNKVPYVTLSTMFRSCNKTPITKKEVIWKSFTAGRSLFQRNFKSNSAFLAKVPLTFQPTVWLINLFLFTQA